jgi:hypothetical protein
MEDAEARDKKGSLGTDRYGTQETGTHSAEVMVDMINQYTL